MSTSDTMIDDGDDDLVTILEEENKNAIGYLSDEVSADIDDNLDRYLGKPYGDEEEGSSNAMSMDVAEIVDWALPDLLEPFISGDRVAEFEPNSEDEESYCDDATEYVDHVFMVDNSGTIVLHDVAKTAFIQKIGIAKLAWRDDNKVTEQEFTGLSLLNVGMMAEDGFEIIEQTARPVMPGDPEPQTYDDGMVYDVKARMVDRRGTCEVMTVPPEEFKISSRATDIEAAGYVCHEVEKTRAYLIDEMGFDEALVMSASGSERNDDTRHETRFYDQQRREDGKVGKRSETVLLKEEYLRHNGKVLQVFRVGKTILQEPVEVEEHPFVCWSPDRIPHRLIGLGLADKVKQTQRVKTVLTRQFLDNVYLANNPRIEVPADAVGEDTYDDLLTYRIGGLIRTKAAGMLNPIAVPDMSRTALQALTYMDQVREQQSGIVKNGMAISSEVIDPKSATESRRQDRNEQVRKRLMARMFGDTFVAPLYAKILRTVIRHQDFVRSIKVKSGWKHVDPRPWSTELRCRVSVGLGYTNRDELIQGAQLLLGVQQQAIALGMATPKHLFKTAEKLVEGVGFRFADQYFVDPESEEGAAHIAQQAQQAAQNPEAEAQKAKLEIEAAKAQMQGQIKAQQAAQDIQIAEIRAQMDHQIAQMKAEMEFRIAQAKIAAETQLSREKMGLEAELKREEMDRTPLSNGAGVRFGGQVG